MASAASKKEDSAASEGKERVGNYSLDGLAVAWDDRRHVRQRLRTQGRLLIRYNPKMKREEIVPQVDKTIHNARVNRHVLPPVLHLVRLNSLLLPNIDRLIQEVHSVYSNNNIRVSGTLSTTRHGRSAISCRC